MNLLAGVVEESGLRLGETLIPLSEAVRPHVYTGQVVTLGVRPEALRLAAGAPDGARLRGLVELVEPDFARQTQLVHVRTGTLAYVATGPLDTSLNIGDAVEVAFPAADQLYFFDTQSELRIG